MRYLAQGESDLAGFSVPMKLTLSCFVLFILLGLASSIALYHQQFHFSSDRAAAYYRGNAGQAAPGAPMMVEKSYRQLLETAHFHLFIMPLVYLALLHLYFLSTRPSGEKVFMVIATFLGLLLEVAAPWLVRYGGAEWSSLFWISGPSITLPTLWVSGVCLWELWLGRAPETSSEESDR